MLGPLAGTYGVGMTGQAMVEAGSASGRRSADHGWSSRRGHRGRASRRRQLRAARARRSIRAGTRLIWPKLQHGWRCSQQSPPSSANIARWSPTPAPAHAAAACYDNLKLVAAVGDLALLRTGLTSSTPGALLSDRAKLRAQAFAWLAGGTGTPAWMPTVSAPPASPARASSATPPESTRLPRALHDDARAGVLALGAQEPRTQSAPRSLVPLVPCSGSWLPTGT